ncbi:hypothetical protein Z043_116490, partial [Scleropages formosus]
MCSGFARCLRVELSRWLGVKMLVCSSRETDLSCATVFETRSGLLGVSPSCSVWIPALRPAGGNSDSSVSLLFHSDLCSPSYPLIGSAPPWPRTRRFGAALGNSAALSRPGRSQVTVKSSLTRRQNVSAAPTSVVRVGGNAVC